MNNKDSQKKAGILDDLLNKITPVQQAITDDRMTIAANIDELLKEKAWSKKMFAEKMAKEPSVITRWLSGTHNFTTETLSEIRLVLGVNLTDLVQECRPPVRVLPNNELVREGSTFIAGFFDTSIRLEENQAIGKLEKTGAFHVITDINPSKSNLPSRSAHGGRKTQRRKTGSKK